MVICFYGQTSRLLSGTQLCLVINLLKKLFAFTKTHQSPQHKALSSDNTQSRRLNTGIGGRSSPIPCQFYIELATPGYLSGALPVLEYKNCPLTSKRANFWLNMSFFIRLWTPKSIICLRKNNVFPICRFTSDEPSVGHIIMHKDLRRQVH